MDPIPKRKFNSVDEYFSALSEKASVIIKELRTAIKEAVPEAEEKISYNMPSFRFHGILLYYAAHKEHVGFYPGNAKLITFFKEELKDFETSKGTIRFPFGKPLPIELIKKIVAFRAKENLEKEKRKGKKK
jgi:uncharacterized protein YdhG (YjbR/CyaY superfamily)